MSKPETQESSVNDLFLAKYVEKMKNAHPLSRINMLTSWINDLQAMKDEAKRDLSIDYSWMCFKELNELTGVAKVFVDKAEVVSVSNKMITLQVPIKPLIASLPQVKEAFSKFSGSDVRFQVRVSPNTQ